MSPEPNQQSASSALGTTLSVVPAAGCGSTLEYASPDDRELD
jgi:hypothetical protein